MTDHQMMIYMIDHQMAAYIIETIKWLWILLKPSEDYLLDSITNMIETVT